MQAPAPAPAPALRLFLGLWPTDQERAAFERHANAWHWPAAARRTRPERVHLTLHFIGDVAPDRLPQLQAGLRPAPWSGCPLVLDRCDVWPGGIAVLEASQVPPELARLHAELGAQLRALNLPVEERRYRPHVTLARKATGASGPPDFRPLRWNLPGEVLLLQSLAGGRGYLPLQRLG